MSAHLSYFLALDNLPRVDKPVLAASLGRDFKLFLQRRWIATAGHLTHVMVPLLDSEHEVEVEVDEDVGCYRYRSPENARTVIQPLADIALYSIQVESWLADLATLIGIEDRHRSNKPCRTSDHLWHLGDRRIARTHDFAPVFVGRAWARAPKSTSNAVLADAVWPRGGVVLRARHSPASLPRDHVMRTLEEFIRVVDGKEEFAADALDRVLRGYVCAIGEEEPEQFLRGERLKLPHFSESRELSVERAKIVKQMWGNLGSPPPVMSWAEVNSATTVATGYQSFDDAFDGKAAREDVIRLVSRGKYSVRRNP